MCVKLNIPKQGNMAYSHMAKTLLSLPCVYVCVFVSFQSEYVSDSDERRALISEFTGSAGVAVVRRRGLTDQCLKSSTELWFPKRLWSLLFTDGHYFLQAEQPLNPANWE